MSKPIDPIDQPLLVQIREILAAGYPTVEFHKPEGSEIIGHFNWWREDKREAELSNRLEIAFDRGDDDAIDTALKAILDYQDEIVSATLAVVAKRREESELWALMNGAASNANAYSESAAGEFLRKIAELALKGLTAE